jgi:multidrug efflux system outer membrane protein
MGPDYRRPEVPSIRPPAYQHAPDSPARAETGKRWWAAFNDPALNRVVEETLAHNWDLQKASARILEVQSQLRITAASRYPSLDLTAGIQRQRRTVNQARVVSGKIIREDVPQTTDAYTLSFPAAFEIDLWGRLAQAEAAARGDLLQALENRRTVAQTVVSEAASLYLQMEALERRIQITEKTIKSYKQSLTLVENRYNRGLTSVLDVRQARRTLARAELLLPPLRQELGGVQQQLAVLAGRYPETRPPRLQPDAYFQRMAPIPPGIPSDLLERRPDVGAAEARLKALNARVGAAMADRFPRIRLTGSLGYASEELGRLFNPSSRLWSLAAGLVQPLFDAGERKSAQEAAEARYAQGVADYAKTVLNAFAEVEGALLTRKEQFARRARTVRFLEEARATRDAAERRYRRGLADYLSVLEAQQTQYQAEETLVLVDLAIFTNRVALHRALGGGWEDLEGERGEGGPPASMRQDRPDPSEPPARVHQASRSDKATE